MVAATTVVVDSNQMAVNNHKSCRQNRISWTIEQGHANVNICMSML